MYLKKLELVGFKSFLNKTTLHFEPGVTAVVGPNGCGKSNIFDSIRWVLGEQSAKSLRGSDMQDVIFNGTDSKEALSMAEVTLTFDNSNKFFNIEYDELAITRRLFRSGESEYLLNKNLVRLKDILDILLGTGVGAESYSIVAQGKIDLVLSSRPEDRRLVFDEAAGITKYKSQKRETIRRLEETEQNLLRVNDIVTEVKRQIGSLERQANKARRYREVFDELKAKEINLASWQKVSLLKEKGQIINALSGLEAEESALTEVIKEQESKISNRQQELRVFEDNIMSVKNDIMELNNLVVRSNERISFNQEKIEELREGKAYLESQINQAKEKLVADEDKLNTLKSEYSGLENAIQAKTIMLTEKEAELHKLGLAIKASLENITLAKKTILDLVSRISNVKNAVADHSSKQQIHLARKKRLQLEKAKVDEEKCIMEDNVKVIAGELDALNKIIEGLNSKVSAVNEQLVKEQEGLGRINADIERLERKNITLHSHKEFIERLRSKYEDIGESMNAVIYLDKMPGDSLNGLVIKIKDKLNLSDEDKAYFQPAELKLSGEAKSFDLDTNKISEKINKVQQELYYLENARATKETQAEEFKKSIVALTQELRVQDIAIANKKTNYETALEQFSKIKEEEDLIVLELSDVEKELLEHDGKISALKSEQTGLENQHKDAEDTIVWEQNDIASSNSFKESALVAIAQTKTEVDDLNRRVTSDSTTLKLLEDTYLHDKESLSNIEKQIQDSLGKKNSLEVEMREIFVKIEDAAKAITSKKESLVKLQEGYEQASVGSGGVIKKIEEDRAHLDEIKNKLYDLEMHNKDTDFKLQSIKDRLLQSYKVDLGTLVAPAIQDADENLFIDDITKLKDKLDSYGTVNLVAIEEYDELKQRYDFLIQQQTDLNSAKESLHEAILKINRTTRKMFIETFEKVREEFRNYFRMLFNGGDAQVFLVDEQDPLESGIEIICRPPGKKLQNVLLLSGGEKSMSAIALIFAIFKVKPSPFCILDEIDAALDEANVDRYSRLLQEFAKISQFIVITHNKKTIVNANVMYGITMEESGVSKIVSVKFAQGNPAQKKGSEVAEVAPA